MKKTPVGDTYRSLRYPHLIPMFGNLLSGEECQSGVK